MRVLVVGFGGREHALVWKLSQSAVVEKIIAAPGNAGIAEIAQCFPISALDHEGLKELCQKEEITLAVIGPESPLIAGVADTLREVGISVYGPSRRAAQIEGNKAYAKTLMQEEGIPTAEFEVFTRYELAKSYVYSEFAKGHQLVVKASGEAFGKGAIVCESKEEALNAVARMLLQKEFGSAGETIVIEKRLYGPEVSLQAICNGKDYLLLPSSRDYKSAYEGGKGPNTGGMGAYSPVEELSEEVQSKLGELFIRPVLEKMSREETPFIGTLYAGLMITEEGPKALEYNVRFGDPETQAILPRIENDFATLLENAACSRELPSLKVSPLACACIVIAIEGYPGEYPKGIELPDLSPLKDFLVFHAGTERKNNKLVNTGGRVLNIVGMGESPRDAADKVYNAIEGKFPKPWRYRKDIGTTAMENAVGLNRLR
ncbi:MAG TPA: phosphoribosylamine--glycine ligase [Fimbriimonadales bacterium]|nr:phosphoribosylamine--glycine ligase [Fimbriimonadales bacterium]